MNKLTTEEFITKAKKIYGDTFDYSKVNYVNNSTKIILTCNVCGYIFEQVPASHLCGCGCPKCNGGYKYSKDDFLKRAHEVHGDKYDYSKANYINCKTKLCIVCKQCGNEFYITPNDHLQGRGCHLCGVRDGSLKYKRSTLEGFIEKARKVHGDLYDYSGAIYKDCHTKLCIKCNTCGHEFMMTPTNHVSNATGCPECCKDLRRKRRLKSHNTFIQEATLLYGDRYDYSETVYKRARDKITVKCNHCGTIFKVTADNHLHGSGCPVCKSSRAEILIAKMLHEYKISFETQKAYPDLYFKSRDYPLRYDFYIPDHNLLIEYNGKQHYESISFFHGMRDSLALQKRRDKLKSDYARDHGLKLLVIKYDEDIEMKLKEALKINE